MIAKRIPGSVVNSIAQLFVIVLLAIEFYFSVRIFQSVVK